MFVGDTKHFTPHMSFGHSKYRPNTIFLILKEDTTLFFFRHHSECFKESSGLLEVVAISIEFVLK